MTELLRIQSPTDSKDTLAQYDLEKLNIKILRSSNVGLNVLIRLSRTGFSGRSLKLPCSPLCKMFIEALVTPRRPNILSRNDAPLGEFGVQHLPINLQDRSHFTLRGSRFPVIMPGLERVWQETRYQCQLSPSRRSAP
ncbi:hypothetical protein RRG08_046566 [Elysia crispata]|uniref:Uncharacterized protein n=1 Tax=Elysia crispata TaxID=231223 RepID=A0AAE1E3D9_9GAST|nr:hypothetical protein RRG08_046566 [Elysia crispata]